MEKYTTEQIGFAIKCRNEGLSWSKVADKMVEMLRGGDKNE